MMDDRFCDIFSAEARRGTPHRVAAPAVCSALEHRFLCCQRTVEPKSFQSNGVPQKRAVVPILLQGNGLSIIGCFSY